MHEVLAGTQYDVYDHFESLTILSDPFLRAEPSVEKEGVAGLYKGL